jgi:DNA-binding beta-propeller fold protein YncE
MQLYRKFQSYFDYPAGFDYPSQMKHTWGLAVAAVALVIVFQSFLGGAQQMPKTPEFEFDSKWPIIPNNWVLGEVTSISVDRHDNIWVLHVPQSIPEAQRANAAPPVLEFDAAGKLLTSWGGPTNGPEWLGREHGIFVDANDFVWIGGRAGWPRPTTPGVSDDMILKFTMAGKLVMKIGASGQSKGNLDTENVHQATDVFVDTAAKEVYAADGYGNKRVIVFDSETGKFKRMWGAFGNPPPATLAANPAGPQPQTTPDGPPEFGLPHAIKVSADGVVYVADRINNRIQLFTTAGKFIKQVRVTNEGSTVVPVPAGFAFSPDAKQQFLYVVDSGPMRIVIFDRATMTQIGAFGNRSAKPGDFDIVHHMAADSKGNLYTAEIVTNRRAQRFVLKVK